MSMESSEPPDDHAAHEGRSRSGIFSRLARRLTAAAGSGTAAAIVVGSFVLWVGVGARADFPRWWELCATVGPTFVTLLMLVLIQHTESHNDRATQLKLDELIRASHGATNRMMTVEDASPQDLDKIQDAFRSEADSATPAE
jgi:low affinity Fe/Cu permease